METVAFSANPLVPKLPKISIESQGKQRQPSFGNGSQEFSGLNGPSYSLTGSKEKFQLPPPSTLQPGLENNPGKLDSWPVHPLNQAKSNLSLGHSSNNGSLNIREQTLQQFKPGHKELLCVVPKPKFLEQLESYLLKELRFLGYPPPGTDGLRLQPHREVFEYLIEDFKTYKPLLSTIKNEYELYIESLQELIKELEPLEAQLETVREDCERKIMNIREEERQEDAAVQRENQRLQNVISDMKNQELAYQAQITKLQAQVEELYSKHRYEADARKLLISDYNDLKFRQQESKGEEGGGQEEREDPVLLKLKLARAREDLRTANQRINTMLADYGDVVPRREFEMLETSYKSLETDVDTLKNDHGVLIMEHSTLQSIHKDALSDSEQLKTEFSQLKRSATPRPHWDRCASYITGGSDKWTELTEGRSSDGKVDILLAQIAGVDVSEITKEDTLQGQGMGDSVPRYLRWEEKVRNRHITRGEANSLISGFWHHRITSQQDQQPIDECLYEYLLSRNDNDEALAIEDGYNLQDSVSRLAHEPHVKLFGEVLRGELSETVFHGWLATQTMLTEAFHQQQKEENAITEETLRQVLMSQLSPSDEQLNTLVTTAVKLATVQPGTLDFIKILSPDKESQPSEFVLLLLEQNRKASKSFISEILKALTGKTEVSLSDLDGVIKSLDPAKPTEELHTLYSVLYSVAVEQVETEQAQQLTLSNTELSDKLNYTGLTRATK